MNRPKLSFQVNGDHDCAGVEGLDGFGERQIMVRVELVDEALAQFYFGRENEVGIIKLESYADFVPKINRTYLQKLIGAVRTGICSKVIIEFAAQ